MRGIPYDKDANSFVVTAVDRYDWDGSYLDSYCLPDTSINYVAGLPDGRVVARNFAEGIICQLELIHGR